MGVFALVWKTRSDPMFSITKVPNKIAGYLKGHQLDPYMVITTQGGSGTHGFLGATNGKWSIEIYSADLVGGLLVGL